MTLIELYQHDLQQPGFINDPAQANAVVHLQRVYDELVAGSPKSWFSRSKPLVRGLYMWGGVGRGKTYLMDRFYQSLPFEAKMRMHFYRFMQRIHNELRVVQGKKNPLQLVAKMIAKETRVLCFDEFLVVDIADSMILGLLLEYLFAEGVCLITTSNVPPNKLYEGGLQREQFLPAIKLLEQNTEIVNVDNGSDYRDSKANLHQYYYFPLCGEQSFMRSHFEVLRRDQPLLDNVFQLAGRNIVAIARAVNVAWFEFAQLCKSPRGQADYIELAKTYTSVMISGVPQLSAEVDDEARRFIGMVDEFYDNQIKLVLSAAVAIEELYVGTRLQFEFKRTISRLHEMQSQQYWQNLNNK
ncbi:MAG: cell division protein ZapE [Gammaproteobacteria bacterium]|nr:cell division protein ZapE [Gammaproteobacteria bacterium]